MGTDAQNSKGTGADRRNGIWSVVCGIRGGSEKWDLECCVSMRWAKDHTRAIDSQPQSVSHQSRGSWEFEWERGSGR